MNERTTYELTINEKLQHLPLPNLEDAIWARVKAQLDLDLPSDDGGSSGPDAPSGSGWTWGAGVFLFVAAFVAAFLFFKKPNQSPSTTTAIPVQTTTAPSTTNQPLQIDSEQAVGKKGFLPAPNVVTGAPPGLFTNTAGDSIAAVPENRPAADSLQQSTVLQLPPLQIDTAKPKPKTRGVQGITDDDYRIVPAKRDSL